MREIKIENVFTVSELNNLVKNIINRELPEAVWVCGEIQDLRKRLGKKHVYFNLCQKHPEVDEIIAKVKCVIFENTLPFIEKRLKQQDIYLTLKNDIEVKLLCKIDFYPKWGEFRLIIIDIDPIYTLGKLAQNRQRLLRELEERGLLNKNKNLPFPLVPLKIGLVTAFDSAAWHDFLSELRSSGFGFKIYFYDAYMQGEYTESDIIKALEIFNKFSKEELDVIVITRGGGSTADLSCFDNIKIAEKIANSKFPVLTALGHQINNTIIDFVSYTSLKTPTAIAQFLVLKVKEFLDNLNFLWEEVLKISQQNLSNAKNQLLNYLFNFERNLNSYFSQNKNDILEKEVLFKHKLIDFFKNKKDSLKETLEDLKEGYENIFKNKRVFLENAEEKIKLSDPKKILKRGFSITRIGKRVLKDTKLLKNGEKVKTFLYKGSFESIISNIIDEV